MVTTRAANSDNNANSVDCSTHHRQPPGTWLQHHSCNDCSDDNNGNNRDHCHDYRSDHDNANDHEDQMTGSEDMAAAALMTVAVEAVIGTTLFTLLVLCCTVIAEIYVFVIRSEQIFHWYNYNACYDAHFNGH